MVTNIEALPMWCEAHLHSAIDSIIFEAGFTSRVLGLRLRDGAEVVVKQRPFTPRLLDAAEVQARMWRSGFPCPELVVPPGQFGSTWISDETLVQGGQVLTDRRQNSSVPGPGPFNRILMRVAIFSDIHGNSIALDAVLADITARGGADAYWVLGDLVAIGAEPVATLERLAALPNATFVQGNTERYLLTGERPYPSLQDARSQPELLPRLVEVAHSFSWTLGAITSTGWRDWLSAVRVEERTTLPDGTRVLLTHVAPGLNDGPGIHPGQSDEVLAGMLEEIEAELVCVGHTHWPLDRQIGAVRVVNDGSISNPWSPDLRASYVLIDADDSGYQVQLHRADYDRAAALEAVRRAYHPSSDFIISWLSGGRAPWWNSKVWPAT